MTFLRQSWIRSGYVINRAFLKKSFQTDSARRPEEWEGVIGLEIHAQISAESKLFSGSGTDFAAPINQQVAFLDAALPGTLPVLNQRCVEAGVLTALALNCNINLKSKFDRKHYFYADLPAGYQITQQRQPLATGGSLSYVVLSQKARCKAQHRKARITQVQLEQDSGKSLHDVEAGQSLIDLNRAGMALMEIVTEPDFRSAEEAAAFVRELQLILQTLGTCDGKMDEGSMRVDASVSVRRPGEPLGVRAEVKNINSVRFVAKAIEYEISRQTALLEQGEEVANETRFFDFETESTIAMRDKEKVHDYRFMPEPNLPPLIIYTNETIPAQNQRLVNVDEVCKQLPELPSQTRERLQGQYGFTLEQSVGYVNNPSLLILFEAIMREKPDRRIATVHNLLINVLVGILNKSDIEIDDCPICVSALGEIIDMVEKQKISQKTVKQLLELLLVEEGSPCNLVEKHNWTQITDPGLIEDVCLKVIQENQSTVKKYIAGKSKVFNFLMGQLQKHTNGQAEPKLASQILQQTLDTLKTRP